MNASIKNKASAKGRKLARTLLAGAIIGAICAGTAGAAPVVADAPSVTVRYGDLDLSSDAGTRALYRRLAAAAKQVCPDRPVRELSTRQFVETCRRQAINDAVRQIPSPQLAAFVASTVIAG